MGEGRRLIVKRIFITISKMVIVLLVSILLGLISMVLCYALPVDYMRSHVVESGEDLIREGDRPKWGGFITVSDGFTDAIMLGKAVYDGGDSVFTEAMLNRSESAKGYGDNMSQMVHSLDENAENVVSEYPLYWHGYLVILKPLLYFFNVSDIRIINMIIQTALLMICAALVSEKLGKKYLAVLIPGILFINPITAAISFQFADVYYITLLSLIIMLCFKDWLTGKKAFIYLFLLIGAACAFFDFLTIPIVALGIPLVFYMLIFNTDSIWRGILELIKLSTSWAFGYIGMWCGKWILTSIFTGKSIIGDGMDKILYRSGTSFTEGEGGTFGRFDAVKGILSMLKNSPLNMVLLILILICVILLIVTKRYRFIDYKKTLILGLIALYPLAWYTIVLNHSIIHSFMTWRDMAVTVCAVMACLIAPFGSK